jgi:hypothetical protein
MKIMATEGFPLDGGAAPGPDITQGVGMYKGSKREKQKTYRHPYDRRLCPDSLTRPPLPNWLARTLEEHLAEGKNRSSFVYWTRMYWATPPWLGDSQIARMRALKGTCPDGYELDHEVPLKSNIVCGLNVPWNLYQTPKYKNRNKSNRHWPDMPMQPVDMFDEHAYQYFDLLHPTLEKYSKL